MSHVYTVFIFYSFFFYDKNCALFWVSSHKIAILVIVEAEVAVGSGSAVRPATGTRTLEAGEPSEPKWLQGGSYYVITNHYM